MLGDILRYERERKELKQKEVAEKVHLAPSNYSLIENGKREPDISTLAALADLYGVTTDYLLGRTKFRNDAARVSLEGNMAGSAAGRFIVESSQAMLELFPFLAADIMEGRPIEFEASIAAYQSFQKALSGIRKQFESVDIETAAYLEAIALIKNSGRAEPSRLGKVRLNNRAVEKCVDALYSFIGVYAADQCALVNDKSFSGYADMLKAKEGK